MMRNLCLISCLFLFPVLIIAQQKVSVRFEQRYVTELFSEIEKQIGSKIYFQPEKTDSLIVTVNATNEDYLLVLDRV